MLVLAMDGDASSSGSSPWPMSSSSSMPASTSTTLDSSSTRPWSPRTVAAYVAAVWDEDFSVAEQLELDEDEEKMNQFLAQLDRGMHELAPGPDSLPVPAMAMLARSSRDAGINSSRSDSLAPPWELHEHPALPPGAGPAVPDQSRIPHAVLHDPATLPHGPALPHGTGPADQDQGRVPHAVLHDPAALLHDPAAQPPGPALPHGSAQPNLGERPGPGGCGRGSSVLPEHEQQMASSSSSHSSPPNWFEAVRDRRCLRGEGTTKRFGEIRAGVDRWHYKDGSVRNRLQERQAKALAVNSRIPPSIPEGAVAPGDGSEAAQPRLRPGGQDSKRDGDTCAATTAGEPGEGDSTTAPEDGEMGDVDSASSSSEGPNSLVGFWRHGQWVGRPRTPAELRSHRGGGGEQRAQRKQQRMNDYLAGRWKPAWLVQYIQDKAQRDGQRQGSTETPPGETHTREADIWADEKVEDTSGASGSQHTDPIWDKWRCCSWPSDEGVTEQMSTDQDKQDHPLAEGNQVDDVWSTWSSWGSSSWTWHEWNDDTSSQGWQTWSSGTWDEWTPDPVHGNSWPGWGDLPDVDPASTWTTSSTTIIPNGGLFPEVRELFEGAEGDEAGFMQLTGAERRRMQENGVPQHVQDRVEALLEALQLHQEADRGPESRWALQRLRLRAEEGMQCLDAILQILARRMMPRGFWPVERRPRADHEQMRWFAWVRQWQSIFLHGMEHHLQVPLQRNEQEPSPEFLPSSTASVLGSTELEATDPEREATDPEREATDLEPGSHQEPASSSDDEEASRRARSRSRSRCPTSSGSSANTRRFDDDGNEIVHHTETEEGSASNAQGGGTMWRPESLHPPVVATPETHVDPSTLPGIWRDPPLEDWSRTWGPGTMSTTSSSTWTGMMLTTSSATWTGMMSTTSSSTWPWISSATGATRCSSGPSLYSALCSSTPLTEFFSALPQASTSPTVQRGQTGQETLNESSVSTRVLEELPDGGMGFDHETDVLFLMQSWAWSTTTTSSSSSLAMGEPQEPVRDAVSSQLDLCSQSDTVELIRLLLDRQRALRRQDQQIGLALEEAMARIAVRPHELPYNAMAVMRTIWPVITRESLSGLSSASSSSTPHGLPTQYPRLVLRPWLPRDLGELRAAFPEQDPALIAGYRRRMWRSHVQRLYRDIGRDCPAGNWGHVDDSTLFLVQADGNVPVPNHPSDVPPPERTFVERRLLGTASRRRGCRHRAQRGHAAVPARMAGDETEDTGGLAPVRQGQPARSSGTGGATDDVTEEAEHQARRSRERSRSRDS